MRKEAFRQLLDKYLQGAMGEDEFDRLWAGLESNEDKNHWEDAIEDILRSPDYHGLSDPRVMKDAYRKIMSEQNEEAGKTGDTDAPGDTNAGVAGGIVVQMNPDRALKRLSRGRQIAATAAILLLVLGSASYLLYRQREMHQQADAGTLARMTKTEIIPGGNKAILTLSNGSKIVLDSATNGILALQGNSRVVKSKDGQLTYQKAARGGQTPSNEMVYNTLTTPRGGEYQLTLPDRTKVWLNAGSSIRYPTVFAGKERDVEITGEAYLEVSRNDNMPFKVRTRGMEIAVLGTSFNVNAYEDEGDVKTTLLQGKVELKGDKAGRVLEPGEQGQMDGEGTVRVVRDVDTSDVVAWKNGRIELGGNTIEPIMREVARWYDVDVEYRGDKPTDNFIGGISRQGNVRDLLHILEDTKAVHFIIEGKKIIVMKR